jgi:glycosyltransferase domain-containing protein
VGIRSSYSRNVTLATAVILSYNRQDQLRRQLLYYANKPIHLIIADGSEEDWGEGGAGSIGEMTWEYFRVEGWDSFTHRFSLAVGKVKTDYMLFIDDEECVLWTGIRKAVGFLMEHSGHSCAGGRVFKAHVEGRVANTGQRRMSLVDWGNFSSLFSLNSDDDFERVNLMVSSDRTANIYYQVQRTKNVKLFATSVQSMPHANGYAGTLEIMFTTFIILMGKWEMGRYPYWIRYGGSVVESNSPRPKAISKAESEDMANRVLDLSNDRLNPKKTEIEVHSLRRALSVAYFSSYGPRSKEKLGNRAKSKLRLRTKIASKLPSRFLFSVVKLERRMVLVTFLWCPSLVEYLYPHGPKRVSSYLKLRDLSQSENDGDVYGFERIWTKYPVGVSESQLIEEFWPRGDMTPQH